MLGMEKAQKTAANAALTGPFRGAIAASAPRRGAFDIQGEGAMS